MAKGRAEGHHFLPQFYLRTFGFEKDKEIPPVWMHEHEKEPKPLPISVIAKKRHLYSTRKEFGGEHDTANETALSQIENYIAPVFRKLVETEGEAELSMDERAAFATFIILMSNRTPRSFDLVDTGLKKLQAKTHNEYIQQMPDAEFRQIYDSARSRHPEMKDVTFEEAKEVMHTELKPENLRATHSQGIYAMWLGVEQVLPVVMGMDWTFYVPDDNQVFITSDDPVVATIDVGDTLRLIKPGWGHPSAEITLPLAPRLLVSVTYGRGTGRVLLSEEGVPFMNEQRVMMSERFVYSSRKGDWQSLFQKRDEHIAASGDPENITRLY
jgi:hypothetical protein